jgi:hypothetical protein
MGGSYCVLSNEHSKRDDGWLMSNSIPWAKQKRLWVAYVKIHLMSKAKRQWLAHVTLHPMSKSKEMMGGSCHIPFNEQSKRDDVGLMSHSIQWKKQKRRWMAQKVFHLMSKAIETDKFDTTVFQKKICIQEPQIVLRGSEHQHVPWHICSPFRPYVSLGIRIRDKPTSGVVLWPPALPR